MLTDFDEEFQPFGAALQRFGKEVGSFTDSVAAWSTMREQIRRLVRELMDTLPPPTLPDGEILDEQAVQASSRELKELSGTLPKRNSTTD